MALVDPFNISRADDIFTSGKTGTENVGIDIHSTSMMTAIHSSCI